MELITLTPSRDEAAVPRGYLTPLRGPTETKEMWILTRVNSSKQDFQVWTIVQCVDSLHVLNDYTLRFVYVYFSKISIHYSF
jgi:hypothetical protein